MNSQDVSKCKSCKQLEEDVSLMKLLVALIVLLIVVTLPATGFVG